MKFLSVNTTESSTRLFIFIIILIAVLCIISVVTVFLILILMGTSSLDVMVNMVGVLGTIAIGALTGKVISSRVETKANFPIDNSQLDKTN